MLESRYQAGLIKRIKKRFPECDVEKYDGYIQGIPDLLLLFPYGFWARLEVKASESAPLQPNQQYYVDRFRLMSFCEFIYPENEEAVLNELQQAYENHREARLP